MEERLFTAALRFGQRRASALVLVFADAAIPTGAKAHLKRASNAALAPLFHVAGELWGGLK